MYLRRSQKKFSDYFSPVERTFTDFMSRNASSLLTSANRNKRVFGLEDADAQQTNFAGDRVPQNLLPHTLGGGALQLLGGDEDFEGSQAPAAPPPPRRPREDRREPPREVHPPLRPDPHEERCKDLRTLIASLRISRGTYITERRQVIGELSSVRSAWSKNVSTLKSLEDRLAAYEYQLKLVDQPYPPSLPKPPIRRPTPGPVLDIITLGWINEMKRQIDALRKRIAVLRDLIHQQEARIRELEARLSQIEAKLREADALLLEPEREYTEKCGQLEPPITEWR
jgi:hypothetical protein